MKLGELVRDYRISHNISQRQFATICGLSNGYISMIEKNANPKTGQPITPTLPILKKIATGLGMTLNELFSTIDDMPISLIPISDKDFTLAPVSESGHPVNIVKIAGRDGSYVEKRLTDDQVKALRAIVDQFPDASDDL